MGFRVMAVRDEFRGGQLVLLDETASTALEDPPDISPAN
jgi:hypothetical protein